MTADLTFASTVSPPPYDSIISPAGSFRLITDPYPTRSAERLRLSQPGLYRTPELPLKAHRLAVMENDVFQLLTATAGEYEHEQEYWPRTFGGLDKAFCTAWLIICLQRL